ncbi:MAG: hypothetical protein LBD12_06020 [Clostridiales Family XIII bacterium]|jgi:hypothetical protein|nr:hypothetical protein [Clostridiales Family XIII bacterium]
MNKRRTATAAAVLCLIAAVLALSGWGPDREIYSVKDPPDEVVFNSLSDSPQRGDERDFVLARPVDGPEDAWTNELEVTKGGDYYVQVYFCNDAEKGSRWNALEAKTNVIFSQGFLKDTKLSATISATNANPPKIWDDVHFFGDKEFIIYYLEGSSVLLTPGTPEGGVALPDTIISEEGALIGYEEPDGIVPPGADNAGYVLFRVRVSFERIDGATGGGGIPVGRLVIAEIVLGAALIFVVYNMFRLRKRSAARVQKNNARAGKKDEGNPLNPEGVDEL